MAEMENTYNSPQYLSLLSGTFAFISIVDIQPFLTFAASVIAIYSGILSIRKKIKQSKNEKLENNP